MSVYCLAGFYAELKDVRSLDGRRLRMVSLKSSTKMCRGDRNARVKHVSGCCSISFENKKFAASSMLVEFRSNGS